MSGFGPQPYRLDRPVVDGGAVRNHLRTVLCPQGLRIARRSQASTLGSPPRLSRPVLRRAGPYAAQVGCSKSIALSSSPRRTSRARSCTQVLYTSMLQAWDARAGRNGLEGNRLLRSRHPWSPKLSSRQPERRCKTYRRFHSPRRSRLALDPRGRPTRVIRALGLRESPLTIRHGRRSAISAAPRRRASHWATSYAQKSVGSNSLRRRRPTPRPRSARSGRKSLSSSGICGQTARWLPDAHRGRYRRPLLSPGSM